MTTIIDLRRRLVDLDAQIEEHKRVLQDLEETRIAVERELYTIPFPVLMLPPEITAEIFVHCLPPFADLGVYHRIGNTPLVSLMRVCRAWRDIALATPVLWSVMDFPYDSSPILPDPRYVDELIDRRLTRAGQRPLSFIIRATKLREDVVFLANIIHRYSHRLRYLELVIDEPQLDQLGLSVQNFPLLESASFHCVPQSDALHDVFGNAPRLHEFRVNPIFRTSRSIYLTLPWLQLTKFDGVLNDLELFTDAPNLAEVTCSLEWSGVPYPQKTHIRLNSLAVKGGTLEILQYLTLTGLRHLDVSFEESGNELEAFLIRSSPPLISLSARVYDQGFDWNRSLTHVASTLQNLQLKSPSADLLKSLFPSWGSGFSFLSPSTFPNIRSLCLEDVASDNGPSNFALVRFLYSQSDCLRSFRLVWDFSPFLDARYYHAPTGATETVDTISGHLSRLAHTGMAIYLGTEDENYVP
ncbi:hypothetical protein K438DRAFT_1803007 [Mycena galopus ATCC 62051]|nr:hypothetical protein K438DRAFT_1803007 [Mycena galopus ATCC 62051]